MSEPKATGQPHFYSLDVVRGLGALSVVFWHWQHFFYAGLALRPDFDPARQPLYAIFKPLYLQGEAAVQLFFCLSGFIFYWLYADKITGHSLSFGKFAVLRLSRLYPLHFATLLFVAAAQAFFLRAYGSHFVYWRTDTVHFILQLFLASNWLPAAFTFNGSIWSVSVEILLYGIFFGLCWRGWRRWWHPLLPMAVGYLGIHRDTPFCVGLFTFFAGGLTYQVYAFLARQSSRWILPGLALATVAAWLCAPYLLHPEWLAAVPPAPGQPFQPGVVAELLWRAAGFAPELVLFPLTILTLALWEQKRGVLGKRFLFLGQISYSCYLLHFPLQMGFVATTRFLGVPVTFYYTPLSLLLYFALLVPLSWASFHFFELPCQTALRARFLARTDRPGEA